MNRVLAGVYLLFAALLLVGCWSPVTAAGITAQGPCLYTNGYCAEFTEFSSSVPLIRSYSFSMPGAGKAMVRFDGTMQCSVSASLDNMDVIDLTSQIVTNAADVPDYTKPGGGRYAFRINKPNAETWESSVPVNLASSRTLVFTSGGTKTVHFKLVRNRMDPYTRCRVFTAAFTVITLP